MKKVFYGIVLVILIFFYNFSFAENEININTNKDTIKKGEEISVSINVTNTKIISLTLEIYFNTEKLEYMNGPENSNFSNNRIIYTLVKSNDNEKINIGDFNFKAINEGISNIVVIGEGYDLNENKIEFNNSYEIKIAEIQKQNVNVKNVSSDNTDLQIMRLNHEGISPEFSKDIKEYYFVADNSIEDLEVTAVPENINATVNINGNRNLKMGLNTINIEIISEDGTKKTNYKIHVTKTNNINKANANLETLAVRQGDIEPEFDSNVTKYKVEVSNGIQKLDILAIPQMINAKVQISSGDLKIGENKIEVVVIAEDEITRKKYEILATRRSEEQEVSYNEQQKINNQNLEAILEEKEVEQVVYEIEEEKESSDKYIILGVLLLIIIGIIVIFRVKRKNKK